MTGTTSRERADLALSLGDRSSRLNIHRTGVYHFGMRLLDHLVES